ncbi:MAG TPA: hypothetical protein VL485_03390 [Ktedonobacteraceae bacterium]|nr:hypothetical protein [Ktedonobacteraceae bacterium]
MPASFTLMDTKPAIFATPWPTLALHIIPPLHSSTEHAIALEATMQSLVLDQQHPIALELVGTNERRSFIVRATSQAALDHAEALLRAQYPQSEIRPLKTHEDAFRLDPDEAISAVELVAGTASFLPLRTWQEAQKEGTDPLLGLLAAMGHLPERTRVIAQLGLIPAVSDWSRWNLRRAIENPLETERRAKERERMIALFANNFSNTVFINIGILVGFLFLVRTYIPKGVIEAITKILTGKGTQIPSAQLNQLILYVGGIVLLEVLLILAYVIVHNKFFMQRTMYDPRVVSQKISRIAYRTSLRLYVIGPKTNWSTQAVTQHKEDTKTQNKIRKELMLRMVAAYRQFHMANGAFFVPKEISAQSAVHLLTVSPRGDAGWAKGLRKSRHMISVDALATLWHMPPPQALPELALVEHRRARTLLIPPAVTYQCQGRPAIGYSEHAGYRLPFALTPEFFTFHTLFGGKAGEGKSTFIQYIAQEAMQLGGLVLIDPFGDLCEQVLKLVPVERAEDVVFIDLADSQYSVGLNPLDVTPGHGRDKFITDLLKMLAQIWMTSWNAKMENAFEMSLRTLFEANKILIAQDPEHGPGLQYTLLDILPLLTNTDFCHTLLQEISDDYLHRWWHEYYEPLSSIQQRDVINPIATKVAKFESLIARRILGQSVSTLNIPRMIEQRKIILFKLARGIVGNEVASMVGATLLSLIQNTLEAQERQQYIGTARLPIIIDEFQRVAGADYRTLSELHKYGATFFLGTQSFEYLQKVNPLLWPTLQANVRQFVAFNMSAQDAHLISKELGVDQEDILHLDISTCYVSVLAAGRRQPTFSLKLNAPSTVNAVLAESVRTHCRIRYTRPIAEVDKQLSDAMLRSIRMVPQPDAHLPQVPEVLPPAAPVPPLALSTKDPTSPLAEEEGNEGTRYRVRRERPGHDNREATRRLVAYRERSGQWSNAEDIEHMEEETTSPNLLELLESWEGLSDEQREELELMEIEAYNATEREEADAILDDLEVADEPPYSSNRKNRSM